MSTLLLTDEKIENSYVYIGYRILSYMKSKELEKVSIYEISKYVQKNSKINSKQFIFALSFLYSLNLIDFRQPYIIKT